MRSVAAPESKRAQASASSMTTSAMVSVLMICANGSAFSSQGGTASCFFLAGRSIGEGFGQPLEKGETQALCACTSSFPTTSIPFTLLNSRGAAANESLLSPLIQTGLHSGGLLALACLCRSLGGA